LIKKTYGSLKSGFGGTELLLSGLYTEGIKRGLSVNRMAELLSANPAARFGLPSKGSLEVGKDADIVLFDTVLFSLRFNRRIRKYTGICI
jgi:dihydroorotase-like cyclic amidohydrolase